MRCSKPCALRRRSPTATPTQPLKGAPIDPPADAASPADLRAFIRRTADTIFHPVGSCRMGLDAASVVDPKLRVRGVDALWVMDGSVMPCTPNAQTFAASLVIAEKGARQLK